MAEFEIIRQYFQAKARASEDVLIGIGDDAAVISVKPNHDLAITTDTLVEGVHFQKNTDAFNLGHKCLAVNLSDLAAMGATPAWITLALTLPHEDHAWLKAFSDGLFTLANQFKVSLIGGDLTQGPLAITIQAMGYTPAQQALRRSSAKPGDLIYVSGTLGDAALALLLSTQDKLTDTYLSKRLHQPEPRIQLGEQLCKLAHAAIDISDGFAADLSHILVQSQVGAEINVDQLPLSTALKQHTSTHDAIHHALTGGDDYELCFTIPPEHQPMMTTLSEQLHLPLTLVGIINNTRILTLHHDNGSPYHGRTQGYQHFK